MSDKEIKHQITGDMHIEWTPVKTKQSTECVEQSLELVEWRDVCGTGIPEPVYRLKANHIPDAKKMVKQEKSVSVGEPVALEALKWIASLDLSGADDRAIALMAYAIVSKARFAVLEATGERA